MILAGDVGGTKASLALYRREARGLLLDRMATYVPVMVILDPAAPLPGAASFAAAGGVLARPPGSDS